MRLSAVYFLSITIALFITVLDYRLARRSLLKYNLMSRMALSQQTPSHPSNPPHNSTPTPKNHKQDINGIPHILHQARNQQGNIKNRSAVYAPGTAKAPNGRRSVDSADQQMRCIDTNSSFFSKKTETTSRSRGGSQILDLGPEDDFQCPSCAATGGHPCVTCGDSGAITKENSLIKFLSYVIEFKLGRQPSYSPPQTLPRRPSRPTRTEVDTLRQSDPGRSHAARGSLKEGMGQCPNIHYGYFCNSCNNERPIEGVRFTCLICQDYDLCEACYNQCQHRHLMTEIKFSHSYRHSLHCWQRLSQHQKVATQGKGVKALEGKLDQLQEKIYSSSIR